MPNSLELNGWVAGGILERAGRLPYLAVSVTCTLGPLEGQGLRATVLKIRKLGASENPPLDEVEDGMWRKSVTVCQTGLCLFGAQ